METQFCEHNFSSIHYFILEEWSLIILKVKLKKRAKRSKNKSPDFEILLE